MLSMLIISRPQSEQTTTHWLNPLRPRKKKNGLRGLIPGLLPVPNIDGNRPFKYAY